MVVVGWGRGGSWGSHPAVSGVNVKACWENGGATRQWLSGCYSKASAGAPTINSELLPAKPRLFMSTQRAGIKNRPCID